MSVGGGFTVNNSSNVTVSTIPYIYHSKFRDFLPLAGVQLHPPKFVVAQGSIFLWW